MHHAIEKVNSFTAEGDLMDFTLTPDDFTRQRKTP